VCQKLSIDSSSVFFLENYVDTKVKQFYVDKGVLRILLAMICRADDFLTFDRLNPSVCPFPANPYGNLNLDSPAASSSSPKANIKPEAPPSPSQRETTPVAKSISSHKKQWQFIEKLPDTMRERVAQKLQEEEIDDDETLMSMTMESWRALDFKMGEITKIMNALK